MALKIAQTLSRRAPAMQRGMSGHHAKVLYEDPRTIGTREVVGFGINGASIYFDDPILPFPAIRYREEDSTIKPIREKEKGDWKKLTLEEKKALYRFSYCQTYSEMNAPTAEWKLILGYTLIGLGLSYSLYLMVGSLTPQHPYGKIINSYDARLLAEQRKLDMGSFRDRGFGPYWDIEKRDWKEGAREKLGIV